MSADVLICIEENLKRMFCGKSSAIPQQKTIGEIAGCHSPVIIYAEWLDNGLQAMSAILPNLNI